MGYWAEIRNSFFRGAADIDNPLEGEVLATISIDAWKTQDDWEEGSVVACVMLSKHGDVLVDYRDNIARVDEGAQKAINEAKKNLEDYYRESVIGQAVLPAQKPSPSIDLWARLGISLGVTPEELEVLKGGGMAAQDLFVVLVRSDRCEMSGETYFPADCNEEYLGDIDGDLEFDLACALHDNEARQTREFSPEKIEAAKQCLVDNGIEADEAETVLQALGYVLLDRELFPQADVDLGFYEASIFEVSSGKYLADEHQGKFELGPKDERLLFYDEADAERVLALLNDVSDLCFVLIDERIQEKDNTIVALDDAIASAEKVSGAQEITKSIDDRER